MRRFVVVAGVLACLVPLVGAMPVLGVGTAPALGKAVVGISASPNPVVVGQRVAHLVDVAVSGRLDAWVSAAGFGQPGLGSLPPGAWWQECCPSQTAGTPAWHYRSFAPVPPGTYRFGAEARRTGSFLSSASVGFAAASVWVRVVQA